MATSLALAAAPANAARLDETCHREASPSGPITTAQGLVDKLEGGETGCLRTGTYVGDVTVNKGYVHLRTHPAEPMAKIQGRVLVTAPYVRLSHLKLDGRNAGNLASPTLTGHHAEIYYSDIENGDSPASCVVADNDRYETAFNLYGNRIHDCGSASSSAVESAVVWKRAQYSWIGGNAIFDNADRGVSFESTWSWSGANTLDGNGHGIVYVGAAEGNENTTTIVTNSQVGWNASRSSLTGTDNTLEACRHASNPNPAFNANGGIETGLDAQVALTGSTADPLYVNRTGKDFRLQAGSPCGGMGADSTTASDAPRASLDGRPVAAAGSITFKLGSTKPSSTFECRFDYAGGTGTWASCGTSRTYGPVVEGATYTFRARATAGGLTGAERTYTSTVDSTPPDTTVDVGPSGPTNNDDPLFEFSGTGNGLGLEYECKLDGPGAATGSWEACIVWCDAIEFWCDYPADKQYSNLAAGAYTFRVRAIDEAGNADPSPATRSFTLDTTAPDTQITSGPTLSAGDATYGFASEANATFQCKLDGPGATVGTWAACTAPSKSYTNLAEGTYVFNVRASDQAGNVDQTPATRTTVVDRTPPETSITGGPQGDTTVTGPQFTFTSTETAFDCKLDTPAGAGSWASCSSPKSYSGLAQGAHTFSVRARDPAGNADPTPATRSFNVVTCNATASPTTPAVDTPAELIALLSTGQTGCFRAGTYGDPAISINANKTNITLRSYPGETATLKGRVRVQNSGVTIRELRLDGANSTNGPSPTINAANATIADNEITNRNPANTAIGGICVHPTDNNGTVPNGFVIERNRIHDCGKLPPNHLDHGIYADGTTSGIIRDNVIYDNAGRGISLHVNTTGTQVYNNTIDGNGRGLHFGEGAFGNTAVARNVLTNAQSVQTGYNLSRYLQGTGNAVSDSCLKEGNPNGFDTDGGIEPGFGNDVTLGSWIDHDASDPYVNRAAKDFRLASGSACHGRGWGAPDDIATP